MQERLIVGAGTLESIWQDWPGLHQLTAITLCDLAPKAVRTVVISPHPDDEILATGGLLAMLAANEQEVCVIAVTDGDASHPGSSLWPAPLLAAQRRLESVRGLSLLSLSDSNRQSLGLPDGKVNGHLPSLVAWLVKLLRPDDLVVTTWALDGHPDHEASAQAAAEACARLGARHLQVPVWMWHWAVPADERVPWARMVRLPLTADALQRKTRALAAHRTQLEPQDTGRPAVLERTSTERLLRACEYFILPT